MSRNVVSIDEFFDEMPEANLERPASRGRRAFSVVMSLLTFVLIVTLVPTFLALPFAVAVKASADEAGRAYDAIPAQVPAIPSSLPGYTYMYDSKGNVIAQFYSENRIPVTYDSVSPWLTKAIVDVEDRRFWEHHGVDGRGIVRAARANTFAGQTVQGASTLTQQLVENLKLLEATDDAEREQAKAQTLQGKAIEAKTAMEMEEELSKEQILETYMNVVYFGAGSYGVGAASKRFFGVSADELTLPQAALIAGMVREPTGLDPFAFPERAKNRRDTVLAAMRDVGDITEQQFQEAIAEPLDTTAGIEPTNGCATSKYPFYCAIVREQLLDDYRLGHTQKQRDAAFYNGHLAIYTALDPDVMKAINASIAKALSNKNRVATSVVVVQPGTGLVLGIGQNRAWGSGKGKTQIPYATSMFQPGSTFKATVLATAFEQGISPSLVMNANSGYKPNGFDYPKNGFTNSGRANFGQIDMYNAARLSSNVYFARLITKTGVRPVVSMAEAMGVSSSLNNVSVSSRSASFALGAWEVTPLEMADVYATVAAAGESCQPVFITDIVDTLHNKSLTTQRSTCSVAYSQKTASTMTDVLQMPFTKGGTAAQFPLKGRQAVGKTGTTNDHAAAWFVGATPQYATAVWIGDPRGGQRYPLDTVTAYGKTYHDVFGADISGPLWNDIMTRIHKGKPVVTFKQVSQSPVSPKALTDLVTAPNVRGMALPAAVSLLSAAGYDVAVDSSTVNGVDAGVVASSSTSHGYVTLTLGSGSDSHVLGQEVKMKDGVLAVALEGSS